MKAIEHKIKVIASTANMIIDGTKPPLLAFEPPLHNNTMRFMIPASTPAKPFPVMITPLYLPGNIPAVAKTVPYVTPFTNPNNNNTIKTTMNAVSESNIWAKKGTVNTKMAVTKNKNYNLSFKDSFSPATSRIIYEANPSPTTGKP